MANTFNIKISGVKVGSTTLSITAQADGCKAVTKSVAVNVTEMPETQLEVAETLDVYAGAETTLSVTSDATNIEVVSADETIATAEIVSA